MQREWKSFEGYIADLEAIEKLACDGIINKEETLKIKSNLLASIIATMQSEVDG